MTRDELANKINDLISEYKDVWHSSMGEIMELINDLECPFCELRRTQSQCCRSCDE